MRTTFAGRGVRAGGLLAAVSLSLALPPAHAADSLDEIVVTTRKRDEDLQRVPIAIDTISSDEIEVRGIRDLADVTKTTPSVQFDEGFSQQDTRIAIRGLSNSQGRSQVAFLVDGIDVTSEAINSSGSGLLVSQRLLNDIQQVELVKGPQSALFGRAAFAGAISYTTASPGPEFEGSVGLTAASDSEYELRALLSGPLTDTLGLRLNGVAWTEDGHYRSATSGARVGGGEGYALSLGADFVPADAFSLKARIAWSDEEYDQRAVAVIPNDTLIDLPGLVLASGAFDASDSPIAAPTTYGSAAGLQVTSSENPRTGQDYPRTQLEILRTTLVANWDTAIGMFSSYTGFTDADSEQFFDGDRIAAGRPDTSSGNQELHWVTNTRQFSQELRWASDFDGPVQLTFGGLGWNEVRKQDDTSSVAFCMPMFGPCPPGAWQSFVQNATVHQTQWRSETDHYSLYGMVEWSLTDTLKATLESRWVKEDFETTIFPAACQLSNVPGGSACLPSVAVNGSVDSDYHTPKLTLEWQLSDHALMYASAGKAQKPGGITQAPGGGTTAVDIANLTFAPEEMWAYEIGAKTDWSAAGLGRMRLNGALFYQDYSDKQASTNIIDTATGLPTARILNAAGAEVFGLELEMTLQPAAVDGLTLSLAYTYLDTEYSSFAGEANSLAQIVALSGSCPATEAALQPLYPGGPLVPVQVCLIDRTGNELERAPKNALVAGVNLTRPFADGRMRWFAEANAQFTDERYGDDLNFIKFDSYWNVDLRLGLSAERWDVTLYADNVFDDDTVRTGLRTIDFANFATDGFKFVYIGLLPDPRVVGIRANVKF